MYYRPDFELVLLTLERDLDVLAAGMSCIIRFLKPMRITLVASASCLEKARVMGFDAYSSVPISFLDEDSAVPGLSLAEVKKTLSARGAGIKRAGWYFKQFLLLAYSTRPDTLEYYLAWDSDTIPVRDIPFFDAQGKVLVTMKDEYHVPYFETLARLTGLGKIAEGSFIAEHMMFERTLVLSLLDCIMSGGLRTVQKGGTFRDAHFDGGAFAQRILDCVADADLDQSGFSEYETYGTFVHASSPGHLAQRQLPSSRNGTALFGRNPRLSQLFALSRRYYWGSFEAWNTTTPAASIKVALRRALGRLWTIGVCCLHPYAFAQFKEKLVQPQSRHSV